MYLKEVILQIMLIHLFPVFQICYVWVLKPLLACSFFYVCRSKSSPGVSGINRSDGSFEASGTNANTVLRNELESTSIPRDRAAMLEQRAVIKTNNKYVCSLF